MKRKKKHAKSGLMKSAIPLSPKSMPPRRSLLKVTPTEEQKTMKIGLSVCIKEITSGKR
jgi:hypothetical protein